MSRDNKMMVGPVPGDGGGGDTLGLFGWGCAAGTLDPLAYTRASSSEFCYPILDYTPQISSYPRVAVFQKQLRPAKTKPI